MGVKNKEENLFTNSDDQLNRGDEHFKELLNRPAPPERPIIPVAEGDLRSAVTDQAGVRERAIDLLKNGKAAGPDGIPAEDIKAGYIGIFTDMLYSLLGKIWQEEVVPGRWDT